MVWNKVKIMLSMEGCCKFILFSKLEKKLVLFEKPKVTPVFCFTRSVIRDFIFFLVFSATRRPWCSQTGWEMQLHAVRTWKPREQWRRGADGRDCRDAAGEDLSGSGLWKPPSCQAKQPSAEYHLPSPLRLRRSWVAKLFVDGEKGLHRD